MIGAGFMARGIAIKLSFSARMELPSNRHLDGAKQVCQAGIELVQVVKLLTAWKMTRKGIMP